MLDGYCALEDVLIENVVCTMSNLVIERETFLEIGGFSREMRHVEDKDLLARLVGGGHLLRGIPQTLVGYRMSADGLSCDFASMLDDMKTLAERWAHRFDIARGEALYCRYLARRALRSGTPVLGRDLAQPQVIARNDMVQVAYVDQGLTLTITGRATRDAAIGEPVPILNLQSGRTIEAIATAPGQAMVGPAARTFRAQSR